MIDPPTSLPVIIDVRDVALDFKVRRRTTAALAGLTMSVRAGEFVSITGPSGCGKSTLLRLIAGLLLPDSGEIHVNGDRVTGPPAGVLVLFQHYEKSLLPWRTVRSNIRFALENQRLSSEERTRRVDEALEAVDLGDFARYYPHQLSGGMQQRVAMARALARQPDVVLMDEPFSSLDALTRSDLQDLTLRLWAERKQTIVFVTHDVDESVYLSQRVIVLSPRPAHVRDEVTIRLLHPRDQSLTREAPSYLQARRYLYTLIRNEVAERDAHRDAPVPA